MSNFFSSYLTVVHFKSRHFSLQQLASPHNCFLVLCIYISCLNALCLCSFFSPFSLVQFVTHLTKNDSGLKPLDGWMSVSVWFASLFFPIIFPTYCFKSISSCIIYSAIVPLNSPKMIAVDNEVYSFTLYFTLKIRAKKYFLLSLHIL